MSRHAARRVLACSVLAWAAVAGSSSATPPGGAHFPPSAGSVLLQVSRQQEKVEVQVRGGDTVEPRPIQSGDAVYLVAHAGKALSVDSGGNVSVASSERGERQTFIIDKVAGEGDVESNDRVFFKAWNANMLTVDKKLDVHARWNHRGRWQRFKVEKKTGTGAVLYGDVIFLSAWTNTSLDTDGNVSDYTVRARWNQSGAWQEFVLEKAQQPPTAEPTATSTTSVARHSAPRHTQGQEGCECQRVWSYKGAQCDDYCCNLDEDPRGEWCYVRDPQIPACKGMRYGYCASGNVTTTTTSPSAALRLTRTGCACRREWRYRGELCNNYCCNPDEDAGGEWCFIQDPAACSDDLSSGLWGYCAPSSTTTTTATVPGGLPTAQPEAKVPSKAWEHFRLVNQLRQDGFTCPGGEQFAPNTVEMKFDCRLWKAASLHCVDMIVNDYLDNISPVTGSTPADQARKQGCQADAENVCAATPTGKATLALFLSSAPHCRIILNSTWTAGAVGYAAGGLYRHYWTQIFAVTEPTPLDTSCYPVEGEKPVSSLQLANLPDGDKSGDAGGAAAAEPGRQAEPGTAAPAGDVDAADEGQEKLPDPWPQQEKDPDLMEIEPSQVKSAGDAAAASPGSVAPLLIEQQPQDEPEEPALPVPVPPEPWVAQASS